MDIPVVGEVQAEDHDRVEVRSSRVGGSIQLDQGESAVLRNNRVGQDVQSFSNTGSQISTLNRIDGNLHCKQNNPRPMGGQNTVGGSKQDRCANL